MQYKLIGQKICPISLDIQSSIELDFKSFTEATNKKSEFLSLYPDMSFHIDYNSNVSIDEMLTVTNPKINYSEYN